MITFSLQVGSFSLRVTWGQPHFRSFLQACILIDFILRGASSFIIVMAIIKKKNLEGRASPRWNQWKQYEGNFKAWSDLCDLAQTCRCSNRVLLTGSKENITPGLLSEPAGMHQLKQPTMSIWPTFPFLSLLSVTFLSASLERREPCPPSKICIRSTYSRLQTHN